MQTNLLKKAPPSLQEVHLRQYEVVGYIGDGEYQLKKFGEKGSRYTTRLKENQLLPCG